MAKLVATKQKIQIKWITIKTETSNGIYFGYDAKCSCGWETKVGGAIKSYITNEIVKHKWLDHDYEWVYNSKVGA